MTELLYLIVYLIIGLIITVWYWKREYEPIYNESKVQVLLEDTFMCILLAMTMFCWPMIIIGKLIFKKYFTFKTKYDK